MDYDEASVAITVSSCVSPTARQVPLSVLPYFRFLSEEAQRNVMSQLIDNFQVTHITKRGSAPASGTTVATPASSSTSSPEGLAFMRSPMFAKVRVGVLWRRVEGERFSLAAVSDQKHARTFQEILLTAALMGPKWCLLCDIARDDHKSSHTFVVC